jgi:hypothetical protein
MIFNIPNQRFGTREHLSQRELCNRPFYHWTDSRRNSALEILNTMVLPVVKENAANVAQPIDAHRLTAVVHS